MEKLYEGKSKLIFAGEEEGTCVIRYKNTATAFDGKKKEELEGKSTLNCEISNIIFQYLEKNGIKTHFIRPLNETDVLAKKAEIVLVEVIVRNIAAGSFSKKYGVPEGSALKNTVVEFSFKSDEHGDPLICDSQITAIGLATQSELDYMKAEAIKINSLLCEFFLKLDIILVDFKLEFGRCNGELLLCDEISPDSCRFWDKNTKEKLDKDRFRRDLGDVLEGYRNVLERMKNV